MAAYDLDDLFILFRASRVLIDMTKYYEHKFEEENLENKIVSFTKQILK